MTWTALLLALVVVPPVSVAVEVTHAAGTVSMEGRSPAGDFSCYARTLLDVWDGGASFLLAVEYQIGTSGPPCPWSALRGGLWADPGPDATGDTLAYEESTIVVEGARTDAEGAYETRTRLEPLAGALRLTQSYWRPGAEDDPFHLASGLLAATDVVVTTDSR